MTYKITGIILIIVGSIGLFIGLIWISGLGLWNIGMGGETSESDQIRMAGYIDGERIAYYRSGILVVIISIFNCIGGLMTIMAKGNKVKYRNSANQAVKPGP